MLVNGQSPNVRYTRLDGLHGDKTTTIGFEHEFAQFRGDALEGLSHLRIGRSQAVSSGLGFALETDACNVIELVSPPFMVRTLETAPIPHPSDVSILDLTIRRRLKELVAGRPRIDQFIEGLRADPGLNFELRDLRAYCRNVTPSMKASYTSIDNLIPLNALAEILLGPSLKVRDYDGAPRISAQINLATDAVTCERLQRAAPAQRGPHELAFAILQSLLFAAFRSAEKRFTQGMNPRLVLVLRQLARTLSGELAVPSMSYVKATQERIYNSCLRQWPEVPSNSRTERRSALLFRFHRSMASKVKDVSGCWVRDTVWNIALGVLTSEDWSLVREIAVCPEVQSEVEEIVPAPLFGGLLYAEYCRILTIAKQRIRDALLSIGEKAEELSNYDLDKLRRTFIGPTERVGHLNYRGAFLGARQDTFLPAQAVQMPTVWPDRRLHVIELRASALRRLTRLYNEHPGAAGQQGVKTSD
jgi:hypothetical protein